MANTFFKMLQRGALGALALFLLLAAGLAGGTGGFGASSAFAQQPAGQSATVAAESKQGELPLLRRQYMEEVQLLAGKAETLRLAGAGQEEIARTLHADRRALGVKYKNLTPAPKLEEIYARNLQKYGDKLGPTVEWLRERGKSWEDIIQSAARTGGKDLGF